MAISYDREKRTFTLHTDESTYQMKVDDYGNLIHLYYGQRIQDASADYRYIPVDCGFSPVNYETKLDSGVSMDVCPREYSGSNTGDFRVPSLDCLSESGAVGADLRYVRHEIRSGKYSLEGLPASFAGDGEAETLSVILKDDATGLTAELLYGVFEKEDMLARTAILHNAGNESITLYRADSLCLDIPFGRWTLLHFHGRHCMERMPERVPLMHGIQTVASSRGASSHHHNPFVVLMEASASETHGECIGVMPVYSGNHRTDIEVDQTGAVRVVSGINPETFSWELKPGVSFTAPEVILCRTQRGLEGISHHYHAFIREHLIRSSWKDRRRPVLINSWEAMMFDFTAEKIMRFARGAAALGIEMMVLDDGWFGERNSENAGLGDWQPNETKLPGGIRRLAEGIHGLGLKFGIWIEPEMLSEDSDLYRAHPDWALTVLGRRPAMGRNQLVLDMARDEVVDYLYETVAALLRDNPIDYVKWDMNRNMTDVCSRALPAQRQKEVGHRYILGVYRLMERLTNRFPEVLFEGCAGGGGRFDAGMLYYMPQIWCSDDTDAIERQLIQEGTSIGYPVGTIGSHVSVCPNQQTGRSVPFGTRAVVAMSGAFGYELDPERLTAEEKRQVRNQIERYHRYYDLIHYGRYFRLTGWPDGEDFTAWEFAAEDGSQVLVCLLMLHARANSFGEHICLRGLQPDARYQLTEIHFEGRQMPQAGHFLPGREPMKGRILSGGALMYAGYTLPPLQGDYPSVQLLFTRVMSGQREVL